MQLVGEIELASERGHPHEFVTLVRDLAPPGDLFTPQAYPFEFRSVEMEYESYKGTQVRLRYLLRVTVVRGLGQTVVKDFPFWVRNPAPAPPHPGPTIKMEVGIEECLHIEFEYDRGAYELNGTVVGKIYFLLVRIKLKHMELEIRRRETVGGGVNAKVETETVAKYEIMDGAPVRGEVIPIRLHLAPYDLSPSFPNVHNKFGVKYSLNLVLVDEEDRRYFKQQEITLYRCRGGEGDVGGGTGTGGVDGKSPIKTPIVLTPRTAGRVLSSGSGDSGNGNGNGNGEEQALVTPPPSTTSSTGQGTAGVEPAATTNSNSVVVEDVVVVGGGGDSLSAPPSSSHSETTTSGPPL